MDRLRIISNQVNINAFVQQRRPNRLRLVSMSAGVDKCITLERSPAAIFMAGMPGSGKTTVIKRLVKGHIIVDLDQEIKYHPLYNESSPADVYDSIDALKWADQRVEERFVSLLHGDKTRDVVLDGTGTKTDRHIRRMKMAGDAGFHVVLIHVHVSLETALARNALRDRVVPHDVLAGYSEKMNDAVQALRQHVDELVFVDNDIDNFMPPSTRYASEEALWNKFLLARNDFLQGALNLSDESYDELKRYL